MQTVWVNRVMSVVCHSGGRVGMLWSWVKSFPKPLINWRQRQLESNKILEYFISNTHRLKVAAYASNDVLG